MAEINCIDVSKYQGNINWSEVANSGVEYAIIRVAYRGWGSSGKLNLDPKAEENIEGAKNAGIKIGLYCFSQATTETEAIEEADTLISFADLYGVDLPLYIDSEYGNSTKTGRADGLTKSRRTEVLNAAFTEINNAGYISGVYASTWWYNNMIDDSSLKCSIRWVAHYAKECTYKGNYDIWQYSSTERIPGISTNVDANKILNEERILMHTYSLSDVCIRPRNKTKYKEFAEVCYDLQVPIYLKLSAGDYKKIQNIRKNYE